jgi:hypothetical protein
MHTTTGMNEQHIQKKARKEIKAKKRHDLILDKYRDGKLFRILVILSVKGLPYKITTSENDYIDRFYDFTNDDDVNSDYFEEYINNEPIIPLFNWNELENGRSQIIMKGIIPLWSYFVILLLQISPQKLYPRTTSCPTEIFKNGNTNESEINHNLKNRLRFTNVETLVSISKSEESTKEEVGKIIGDNFDMVVLCDSEGLNFDDFKSYLDFIGMYVNLRNQVSIYENRTHIFFFIPNIFSFKVSTYPPLSIVHALQQKTTYRNDIINTTNHCVPNVVITNDKKQKWHKLAVIAIDALVEKSSLPFDHFVRVGLIAKKDYTCGGDGVYILKYTATGYASNPHCWICSLLCHPNEKVIQTVYEGMVFQFQPYCYFIQEEETRLFTCAQATNGESRVTDLFSSITHQLINGDMTYEIVPRNEFYTWNTIPKYKDVTMLKKKVIKSMREMKKNWTRAITGLIFRIDMAYGRVQPTDQKDSLFVNEIDIFPLAQTLLMSSSENIIVVHDLAFNTYSYIVNNLAHGEYFCS